MHCVCRLETDDNPVFGSLIKSSLPCEKICVVMSLFSELIWECVSLTLFYQNSCYD